MSNLSGSDELLTREKLLDIIQDLKDKPLSNPLKALLKDTEDILKDGLLEWSLCDESHVRFCDYYSDDLHEQEIIDYFTREYKGDNAQENLRLFLLYSIVKNVSAILDFCDICVSTPEEYQDLDECFSETMADLSVLMNTYQNMKSNMEEANSSIGDEEIDLSFLQDHRFGIFFVGPFVCGDFLLLPPHVKKSFIAKLQGELSQDILISASDIIQQIKDTYDVSFKRIHLADDYRLVYMRENGVTIILGVGIKTGKDKDYRRYLPLAKNIKGIQDELTKHLAGEDDESSTHHKMVAELESFLKREKKNQLQGEVSQGM